MVSRRVSCGFESQPYRAEQLGEVTLCSGPRFSHQVQWG